MSTLAENAAAVKAAQVAIDRAIVTKGGTTAGGLTNAAAAIAAIPSGGEPYWTKQPWLNDGWTHAWIKITPEMQNLTFGVSFRYISENRFYIDWGDGSVEYVNASVALTSVKRLHTYMASGSYRVDIYGYDSMEDSNYTNFVASVYNNADQYLRDKLVQVEFGHHYLYGYSDSGMYGTLNYCRNLHYAKFDKSRPSGSFGSFCLMCQSLKEVVLPSAGGITIGNVSCFRGTSIEELTIPSGIVLGNQPLAYTDRLKNVTFAEGTTVVNSAGNSLRMASALEYVEFPSTLTEIAGTYMIYNIGVSIAEKGTVIRLKSTTPPTLNNANNFSTVIGKIIVPRGCADAYKTATNWSSFASKIVEED